MGKVRLATKLLGAAFAALMATTSVPVAAAEKGEEILPKPQSFTGKVGHTLAESEPAFPEPVKAPAGAPNVLLVMTDDVGFAAASAFGGPIPTPNLERLAKAGITYNRFHTTAMCSPTRAALLTGRNHHMVGNGAVMDFAMGFPGYNGVIPPSAATIATTLRLNGYNTAMFGKHHNVEPGAASSAGPFDQWPTSLGFEYFYGFVGANTNQFTPALYRGVTRIKGEDGKLLDEMLADDAISWLHNQKAADPDKPFFVYLAPGTAHNPHQAPAEWIARFRGKFDQGWDKVREQSFAEQKKLGIIPASAKLTPRPDFIPAWADLSPARQQVNARMMEVYAAMLSYQDAQFGRIIDELERMGELENTLVLFIEGDNGASAEGNAGGSVNPLGEFFNQVRESSEELLARIDELGGPRSNQNYPSGWAWAMSGPFQWTKAYASHLGAVRNGLVVSWPKGVKARGLRSQFHHVTDIAPTILEAAGIAPPDIVYGARQQRFDGISMVYSFENPKAPDQRHTQYFELVGNRGIYHDGWWAGTTPQNVNYVRKGIPLSEWPWELYNLEEDFSQSNNLASKYPQKLAEMQALFAEEAKRNQLLPIDDDVGPRSAAVMAFVPPRAKYTYWGAGISVPAERAPQFHGSFALTADIDTMPETASGVLAALGGHFAGWSFYLDKGRPVVVMAGSTQENRIFKVAATSEVPTGEARVRYQFLADKELPGSGGLMQISINGKLVGEGRIEQPIVMTTELTDSFDIGFDSSTTVTDAYAGDGRFLGQLKKLEVVPADKNL